MKLITLVIALLLVGCGSSNKVKLSGSASTVNEANVHIIVDYPQADKCFTSPLITTYEELNDCLEVTTNAHFTVDVNGQIVDLGKQIDSLKE